MRKQTRRFWQDTQGATVVEFALVAPVVMFLVMATIEMSYVTMARSALEAAVRDAARRGGVEDFQRTVTDENGDEQTVCISQQQRVEDAVRRKMDLFLVDDSGELEITSQVYSNFTTIDSPEPFTDANSNGSYDGGEPFNDINGNGQHDADMGAAGLGGPGDVVQYEVTFPLRSLFGMSLPRMMLAASSSHHEDDGEDDTEMENSVDAAVERAEDGYQMRAVTVTRNQSFFGFVCV
jgi:Flp pilus assembly pilin Flp